MLKTGAGLHQSVGAIAANPSGTAPKFVAHSNPLPLSLRESVELDSFLLVLTALFILVPFCLLSGTICHLQLGFPAFSFFQL